MTEEHGSALKRMADLMEGRDPPQFAPDRIEIYKFLHEKAGIALVPKIVSILEHVYRRAERAMLIRIIVRAARGGGKTYSLSIGVEFALWWFFGYDFVNFGGSKSQAQKAYAAILKMTELEEVSPYVKKSLMSETVHDNGNWISVLAASERQTRGGHPGSIDHGGGLFIDEECEVPTRSLVDSVKPVVNTAHPSLIMRASTQHKSGQGGGDETFAECWDKSKEQNYERFEWDIFDVCQHCTRKCEVSIEDDPIHGCVDAFRKGYVDSEGIWQDGYCLGRAHHDGLKWIEDKDGNWTNEYIEDWDWTKFSENMGFDFAVNGWIAIDEIFQDWTETDRRTFEIEYLGRKMERKGRVYDPEMIDNAIEDGNRIITEVTREAFLRTDMKAVGGDWGWTNQTCMVYTFQWRRTVCIYWVDYFRRDRIGTIVSTVNARADDDGIEDAYCDSEGAFENQELGQKMMVKSVAFSVWKDYGVSNLRNLMEKRRFAIVNGLFGRKCPGMRVFIEQMKDYRYDENGNYIKKNDHGPDAAMCALLKWARARITHGSKGKRLRKNPRLAVIKG